jgi:ABC-2 type transport system permease protein
MQLLSGKIMGLGALGLTQLAAWITGAVVIFTIGGQTEFLEGVTFPIDLTIIAILYFLLGYSLIASLMAGIGAVVGSEQESRQYAGVFSIMFAIPYFFIVSFVTNPNGTIPVVLSMFPFTAPMAMVMRSGLAGVPTWQIVLSTAILVLTIILFVWAAARLFRWGLLLYGKKARPRDLIRVLRGRADPGTLAPRVNDRNGREATA